MNAKRVVVLGALVALLVAPVAMATVINDPWAPNSSDSSELNLYQIYNNIFGTNYTSSNAIPQVSPDDVFNLLGGSASVLAEARYAGLNQQFGYYQPTTGGPITYTPVFNVSGSNWGMPLSGSSQVISPSGDFGLYDYAGGNYWYSQSSLNVNGEDHMVVLTTSDPYTFLLAFEDTPFALSDQDFNDLVIEATIRPNNIVPEPTSMSLLGLGLAGLLIRKMRSRVTA